MRRFMIQLGSKKYLLALVMYGKKYMFVNLTTDKIVDKEFQHPNEALDWLDKYFANDWYSIG